MNDSAKLLRQLGMPGTAPERVPGRPVPLPVAQSDEDECPGFGFLRGIRERAVSIEFRFRNGNSEAFPYSWLGPVKYDPSAGLLLKFVGDLIYLVRIEGSNLNTLVHDTVNLYDRGVQRHRIVWIREMTRQELERAGEGEITIERIRLHAHRPDEQPKGVEWLEPFRDHA